VSLPVQQVSFHLVQITLHSSQLLRVLRLQVQVRHLQLLLL
jgi:hypothetical protein